MEKIYEDFTTKMLPEIQKGLVITKDYFTDLFGRYVKYLIVTDSLWLALSAIILIIAFSFAVYFAKKEIAEEYSNNGYGAVAGVLFMVSAVSLIATVVNTLDLVKSIYIPEVRIYESFSHSTK